MPEFDEETYKKKNQNNQALKYEPGRNADKYKSKQPNAKKKGESSDNSTPSLWVEAATSTSYNPPKSGKRKRSPNRDNRSDKSYNKPRGKGPNQRNNRNNRGRNRRKLTLWEKFLSLFGIKPKPRHQKGKGNKKGNPQRPDRQQNQGRNPRRDGKGRANDRREPQSGKANQRTRDNRSGRGKPRAESSENGPDRNVPRGPRSDAQVPSSAQGQGDGGPRRRRPRGNRERSNGEQGEARREPRQRAPRNDSNESFSQEDKNKKTPSPEARPQRDSAREQDARREPRKPRSETRSEPRIESVAAPKVEGQAISLGAIDLGGARDNKDKEATPKPSSGTRGRRNRNSGVRPNPAAAANKPKEFIPHPIEIKTESPDSQKDS